MLSALSLGPQISVHKGQDHHHIFPTKWEHHRAMKGEHVGTGKVVGWRRLLFPPFTLSAFLSDGFLLCERWWKSTATSHLMITLCQWRRALPYVYIKGLSRILVCHTSYVIVCWALASPPAHSTPESSTAQSISLNPSLWRLSFSSELGSCFPLSHGGRGTFQGLVGHNLS